MMGMFIISAILTAFDTIIDTSSWGEVTTIIPSTAIDWNTVRGTSPVPGGISMNIKSTSPQITSVQNCFTVLPIIGPLHTTGSVSFFKSKLTDMISIPVLVLTGNKPSSLLAAFPLIPNAFGIEGPVTSASRIAV
jgi:hypothetical protein